MNSFKPFSCGECGNQVELMTGPGRTREYVRGFLVPIPDDFKIPTCKKCGEIYILPEIEEKLNPILRKRFLGMQADHYRTLVGILVRRHGVSQKDVVRACGVTPSYLSHVLAGKRQTSVTLTRLLEAFVADGSEFERHVQGRPWSRIGVFPFAVQRPTSGFRESGNMWKKQGEGRPANDSSVSFAQMSECVA